MQPVIMKTDGGPHEADYYAGCAAAEIVQIEASAVGADAIKGRKLENQIIDILERFHQNVLDEEKKLIKEDPDRLLTHPDPYEHGLEEAVDEIIEVGKASKWGHLFSAPSAKTMIKAVVGKHMATCMVITRAYHLDDNPDHHHAQSFKAKWHGTINS